MQVCGIILKTINIKIDLEQESLDRAKKIFWDSDNRNFDEDI